MKVIVLILILLLSAIPTAYGQGVKSIPSDDEKEVRRLWILNDLKALESDALKLEKPLAQAAAKAEIADAAWSLDADLSKRLLTEAYQLTFPKEDEQEKPISRSADPSSPAMTEADRATLDVRQLIISISSRDKKFAEDLQRQGDAHTSKTERPYIYSRMARAALEAGDKESTIRFTVSGFELDPTRGAATSVINDLAIQDRAAADEIILKYIDSLRPYTLSNSDQSATRASLTFAALMQPNTFFGDPSRPVPPPGPAVMQAYVRYVIESLQRMEQAEPGSIKFMRTTLMSAWLPLKQYAPELTGTFLELEKLSRRPGVNTSLPTPDDEKSIREQAEKRLSMAAESDAPDDLTINLLIGHGDFDRARKLIDKLPDGPRKEQHTEKVNLKESLALASKGDIVGATLMAERLTKAGSISQIYSALIRSCAGKKDTACVTNLGRQAMRQFEKADASPPAPPAGIPASVFASSREADPVLQGLAKLSNSVAQFDEPLAFEMLDKMVAAANKSEVDTGLGRAGFSPEVFATLAALNETRAMQSASQMDDPLRRVVARAAILKWKAAKLDKASDKAPTKSAVK